MRPRRPTRLEGFSYVGFCRYHLRFCTHDRLTLFTSPEIVAATHAAVLHTSVFETFAVIAHCYMPDHVHLIIEALTSTSDMRRFAKLSKQRVEHALRREHHVSRPWQEGYFERILRSDEDTDAAIRYVLDNPVRAGLVLRAEDYPFSAALYWPVA